MNNLAIRLALVIPSGEQLVVGGWNQLFPRSFYDDVPTVDLALPRDRRPLVSADAETTGAGELPQPPDGRIS